MPHLRLGSRRMAGERAALEMLRQPRAPQVLPEDRDYLRGFPPWLGQVAWRRVADLQLQEWHQQLRNRTRPWHQSEIGLAHDAPAAVRVPSRELQQTVLFR